MSLQIVLDPKIGATVKVGNNNIPRRIDEMKAACEAAFGNDAIASINTAAECPTGSHIEMLEPMAFALGYAFAKSGGSSLPVMRAQAAPAPAAPKVETAQEIIARVNANIGAEAGTARANAIRASQGLPPITSAITTGAKKTFPQIVQEFQGKGMTKGAAVSAAATQFPDVHREWLNNGQNPKL